MTRVALVCVVVTASGAWFGGVRDGVVIWTVAGLAGASGGVTRGRDPRQRDD